jgi:surfactin synthase thioesterase subunit
MILFFPGHKCSGSKLHIEGFSEPIQNMTYPWYDDHNVTVDLFDYCYTIVEMILSQGVKDEKLILIGHSMGSQFVYWIASMLLPFSDKILCITIEGTLWGPFWWKPKALSIKRRTAQQIRNKFIFHEVTKYKCKQTKPLDCQVVSFWNLEKDKDRNRRRRLHEKYWKSLGNDNYTSISFSNLGHFMHEANNKSFNKRILKEIQRFYYDY